jgi:uncharacterized protein YndB with AHSA1/START domain
VGVARASLTVTAPAEEVWAVIADPHHLPRWWPGVERVEEASGDRFTTIIRSRRGRPVRIDLRVTSREPSRRLVWDQELAGTPFERILASSVTELELSAADGATQVTIRRRQRLRGFSRLGGFLVRRAGARQLRDALAGLAQLFTDG